MSSRWSEQYQQRLWEVVKVAVEDWRGNEGRVPVRELLALTVSAIADENPEREGPGVDSADVETLLLEGALTHLGEWTEKEAK